MILERHYELCEKVLWSQSHHGMLVHESSAKCMCKTPAIWHLVLRYTGVMQVLPGVLTAGRASHCMPLTAVQELPDNRHEATLAPHSAPEVLPGGNCWCTPHSRNPASACFVPWGCDPVWNVWPRRFPLSHTTLTQDLWDRQDGPRSFLKGCCVASKDRGDLQAAWSEAEFRQLQG